MQPGVTIPSLILTEVLKRYMILNFYESRSLFSLPLITRTLVMFLIVFPALKLHPFPQYLNSATKTIPLKIGQLESPKND
jgi:hypothetical protein